MTRLSNLRQRSQASLGCKILLPTEDNINKLALMKTTSRDPVSKALRLCQELSAKIDSLIQPEYRIKVSPPELLDCAKLTDTPDRSSEQDSHVQTTSCGETSSCVSYNEQHLVAQVNTLEPQWVTQLRIRLSIYNTSLQRVFGCLTQVSEQQLIRIFRQKLKYHDEYVLRKSVRLLFQECPFQQANLRQVDDLVYTWGLLLTPFQYDPQYASKYLQNNPQHMWERMLTNQRGQTTYAHLCRVLEQEKLGLDSCWQVVAFAIQQDPRNSLGEISTATLLGERPSSLQLSRPSWVTSFDLRDCEIEVVNR